MWFISALGPNLKYGLTACGGGCVAFSGALGRSNSIEPRGCKKEFSCDTEISLENDRRNYI